MHVQPAPTVIDVVAGCVLGGIADLIFGTRVNQVPGLFPTDGRIDRFEHAR